MQRQHIVYVTGKISDWLSYAEGALINKIRKSVQCCICYLHYIVHFLTTMQLPA